MPLPNWLGVFNKHIFNQREIRKGVRPVIHHVGRSSGNEYETPLAATPINEGFLFVVMYGLDSDWVRNVMAAGTARLHFEDREVALDSPQVISMDEATALAPSITPPPGYLRVSDVLRMSTVT